MSRPKKELPQVKITVSIPVELKEALRGRHTEVNSLSRQHVYENDLITNALAFYVRYPDLVDGYLAGIYIQRGGSNAQADHQAVPPETPGRVAIEAQGPQATQVA